MHGVSNVAAEAATHKIFFRYNLEPSATQYAALPALWVRASALTKATENEGL
jgi:hypothetical protein